LAQTGIDSCKTIPVLSHEMLFCVAASLTSAVICSLQPL
jgi:hypothetical protein